MGQHRDMMQQLAREHGWQRGIELGLGSGLLFERFLALGIEMIGVDIGARLDRRTRVMTLGGTVHWTTTAKAAPLVPDCWADFVFIDAGHSYAAVKDDIERWQSKVRPGGWFGGHDYHPSHPGVVRAVDEAFGEAILLHGEAIWSRA